MLILALDSSTDAVTAAVARAEAETDLLAGREVLAEVTVHPAGASESLLPAAHAALGLVGEDLDGVQRVLVGVGPGTFTGIRIALAAARALSLATGAALATNTTLAALAAPALLAAGGAEGNGVLAVLDARRREVFAQRFDADGASSGDVLCVAPGELPGMFREAASLVVGDGAVKYREVLAGLGRIPSDASPLHRVTAAGHVLSADLSRVPAREVVPLYAREPDAEVRRDLNPWSEKA